MKKLLTDESLQHTVPQKKLELMIEITASANVDKMRMITNATAHGGRNWL